IDLAVNNNIIQKSGTWFSYGEERLGQGRENVKKYLIDNQDLLKKINKQVREALGLVKTATPEEKSEKVDKKEPTNQEPVTN
ncbi:MAG: DNA recombination/repair protein RecA, partial [bacterium]